LLLDGPGLGKMSPYVKKMELLEGVKILLQKEPKFLHDPFTWPLYLIIILFYGGFKITFVE
jgi:hypothetical protein